MENNNYKDYPTPQECCKMFDIVDEYLSLTARQGWEWKEAVEFIQSHWNDAEFNIDYTEILNENNE